MHTFRVNETAATTGARGRVLPPRVGSQQLGLQALLQRMLHFRRRRVMRNRQRLQAKHAQVEMPTNGVAFLCGGDTDATAHAH